jgi:hypothetical protein
MSIEPGVAVRGRTQSVERRIRLWIEQQERQRTGETPVLAMPDAPPGERSGEDDTHVQGGSQ